MLVAENNWMPSASIAALRYRARIISLIREFFSKRGYLEVETPIMAHYGITDVYLNNIKAIFQKKEYFLQTSPEYHMKRLLAAGSGPIFQLARVFRDDELGRWHNPEFTLLEWYQLDIDHHSLMLEMDLFLQAILNTKSLIKMTYQQAFIEACGINPFVADIADFKLCLREFSLLNILDDDETDRDQYLFLLMSHVVEPFLAKKDAPVAVYNFPASQASLAKVQDEVALRFEIYYQGVELANGFSELTDFAMQRARFEKDIILRDAKCYARVEADKYLLQALEKGLPECSGVALGVDRLLAISLKETNIAKTLAFDFSRA